MVQSKIYHGDTEARRTEEKASIQFMETTAAGAKIPTAVQEAYRAYEPPFDVKATIEKLVASVPENLPLGLKCVVRVNQSGL
jgi:hypothetical protein